MHFFNKRRAFTMIELIFVIVILGILAAVAVPRLITTRDDAKISRTAYMIMTGVSEIAAYAVSSGSVDTNVSVMSNNFTALIGSGDAHQTAPKQVQIGMGSVANCIQLDINSTGTDDTLNLTLQNSGVDALCDSLQSVIHTDDYPIKLRGKNVVQ